MSWLTATRSRNAALGTRSSSRTLASDVTRLGNNNKIIIVIINEKFRLNFFILDLKEPD